MKIRYILIGVFSVTVSISMLVVHVCQKTQGTYRQVVSNQCGNGGCIERQHQGAFSRKTAFFT
jgi:hypothetical protein